MNENDYFDLFLEMGAMQPEQQEIKRRQAMVDYLRQSSLQAPQAQQAGSVVVAPSWTQALGNVAQAYMARKGQSEVDERFGKFKKSRQTAIDELRRKRQGLSTPPPFATVPATGKKPYGMDEED
jgi:hypothetical protein